MESVVAAPPASWPTRYRSPGIGAVTESAANRRAERQARRPVRSHRPERLCGEPPDRLVRLPCRCATGIPGLPVRGGKPRRRRAFREESTVPRRGGPHRHPGPRRLRGRSARVPSAIPRVRERGLGATRPAHARCAPAPVPQGGRLHRWQGDPVAAVLGGHGWACVASVLPLHRRRWLLPPRPRRGPPG